MPLLLLITKPLFSEFFIKFKSLPKMKEEKLKYTIKLIKS